jgi:acetyl-CoA synthetase
MTLRIRNKNDYDQFHKESLDNPEEFWAKQARSFEWSKPWDKVLDWEFQTPDVKWFINGKLNITTNCLDRHLKENGDRVAFYWEANHPEDESQTWTYRELHTEVCKAANMLRSHGISKGDRICFYMPMVMELVIGVLACVRIGAVHSVVFAGFSSNALADRIKDSQCKMVICSDYNKRGDKITPVKKVVDDALAMGCDSIERVIVHQNTSGTVSWSHLDRWWHDEIKTQSPNFDAVEMDSEDPLFILYTSGSTGKPKGVVHTCGGYMVYTSYSFVNVFQYEENDIFWCTADIGWITGHSYIVYGPLLAGATSVMFEGVPTYPDAGRFWDVCEKYQVNQFYTAPTAIRALMACDPNLLKRNELKSLKVLGTVGEPINEEAWEWYHREIGKSNCPIVDTWWQTETGGILISPLPGITDTKPCYASYPLPGIQPVLLDPEGNEIKENDREGLLCIGFPWPSILRTTYGDHSRCKEVYFSEFENYYFTGDSARRDGEGRLRIIGRVDDVINVSGHRVGTAEVENAINEHPNVVESAVVGFPHEIKGQGIYAYVILLGEISGDIGAEIRATVAREIGPIVKPDKIQIVNALPKTRSGKIMRRLLRKIAAFKSDELGDTSTLLNPEVVEDIIQNSSQTV